MIESNIKIKGSMKNCRELVEKLKEVIDLYDSWVKVYDNAEKIQHIDGRWPMNTSYDRFAGECCFSEMFNRIIIDYCTEEEEEES